MDYVLMNSTPHCLDENKEGAWSGYRDPLEPMKYAIALLKEHKKTGSGSRYIIWIHSNDVIHLERCGRG